MGKLQLIKVEKLTFFLNFEHNNARFGKMIDEFIEREKPGKFLFSGYRNGKMSPDVAK